MHKCSKATGALLDEFVQTADTSYNDLGSVYDAVFQSFQATSPAKTLTGACVRLEKVGSPTGEMGVHIFAHTGTYGSTSEPTGSSLVASPVFDVAGVSTDPTNYWFPFPRTLKPTALTYYTVVVDGTDLTADGSNYIRVIIESGAEATHGGNTGYALSGLAGPWVVQGSSDMAFKVYELDAEDVTQAVSQAIETRIRDNIDAFEGTLDTDHIAWQGVNYQPDGDAWLRPTILYGGVSPMTDSLEGTNLVTGILQIDIFTPAGYGMSESDGYVSAARQLFDRVDVTITGHGDLQFDPSGAPRPGPFDGAWVHTIVECPFQIVENK